MQNGEPPTSPTATIFLVALLCLNLGASHASGQTAAQAPATTEENARARRWFKDAKFGLFIHWGVYSLLGKGEWVMEHDKLPIVEYASSLPASIPPASTPGPGSSWPRSAGAKYITITAKHHDGFCMFASQLTKYDIVDATRYRKDPLKALADACHQEKIKLFFYYSLLDWHHPDYFPVGKTGKPPVGRKTEISNGTSRTTRDRFASFAPITATLAASGLTAGGTGPAPIGTWPAPID